MEYELEAKSAHEIINEDSMNVVHSEVNALYVKEVRQNARGRFCWKKVGDACESLSMASSGVASVLAFATGVYDHVELSFAAGCMSTLALAFLTFSGYAHKESRERTARLNKTLDALGITTIRHTPAVDDDGDPSPPVTINLGNDVARQTSSSTKE